MLNKRILELIDALHTGRRRGSGWRLPHCRRLRYRHRRLNLRRPLRHRNILLLHRHCSGCRTLYRLLLLRRYSGYRTLSITYRIISRYPCLRRTRYPDRSIGRYPGQCGVSVSTGSPQRREAAALKKGESAPPFCGAPLLGSALFTA